MRRPSGRLWATRDWPRAAGNPEEVDAIARIIEEGGELPPLVPDDYWAGPPEPGDQFVARVQGSVDYVNTDLRGSKHFRPPPPDPNLSPEERAALAAAEAAARQHTSSAFVVHRALEYSQVPELASAYARGWETAKELDSQWHTLKAESSATQQEEVPQSIPPPTIPLEAELEYKAAERVAYVLRRAHIDSEDPAAPLLALQSRGLLSEDFVLEDPFLVCEGRESALVYMERLRMAGAKLENINIMCRCMRYEPRTVWNATLDCLIHLPYPAWFYAWLLQTQRTQPPPSSTAGAAEAVGPEGAAGPAGPAAAGAAAAAAAQTVRGPLAGISSADCDAVLEAADAERQQQWLQDFDLLTGMLGAAEEAAAAAGQPLNDQAKMGVLLAGADIILARQDKQQAAKQAETEAAEDAAAAADEAALEQQERWWQALAEGGPAAEAARAEIAAAAAAADAPADQLPPPRLAGVHCEPYEFEGQRREHRWVFLDYEQQHRQRGRQQFDLFPRNPQAAAVAAADGAAAVRQQPSEGGREAEQQRRFALLPPAAQLLQQEWWGSQGAAEPQGQQQAQQGERQQPPASQQQQQQPASAPAGAGSAGSKKKRREGSGGKQAQQAQQQAQQAQQQGQQQQQQGQSEPEPPVAEEELFPFTFDWEKQQRRRQAGRILRRLFGDRFEALMAQLPRRGAKLGRNSNAALGLENEAEGTQWLGGECMTVNATFLYTIDTADSGQVQSCTVNWGSVHGVGLQEVTDAFDVWAEATGMLHEAECDADDEIRAVLGLEEEEWEEWEESGGERGASLLPLWRMN